MAPKHGGRGSPLKQGSKNGNVSHSFPLVCLQTSTQVKVGPFQGHRVCKGRYPCWRFQKGNQEEAADFCVGCSEKDPCQCRILDCNLYPTNNRVDSSWGGLISGEELRFLTTCHLGQLPKYPTSQVQNEVSNSRPFGGNHLVQIGIHPPNIGIRIGPMHPSGWINVTLHP